MFVELAQPTKAMQWQQHKTVLKPLCKHIIAVAINDIEKAKYSSALAQHLNL
jgi:hypothetical protein